MRYSLPLAIAATCLTLGGVRAAQRCPEQPVFDVEALKSEMMVLATACHDDAQYNAFIERYQPSLMATERATHVLLGHGHFKAVAEPGFAAATASVPPTERSGGSEGGSGGM